MYQWAMVYHLFLQKISEIGANTATNAAQMSLDKNRYRNIMPCK